MLLQLLLLTPNEILKKTKNRVLLSISEYSFVEPARKKPDLQVGDQRVSLMRAEVAPLLKDLPTAQVRGGPDRAALGLGFWLAISKIGRNFNWQIFNFRKICQIFSGLVLGCIKTKFCKKICVRQHFSSSTRFAYFCTAAISKFSQKIGLKK